MQLRNFQVRGSPEVKCCKSRNSPESENLRAAEDRERGGSPRNIVGATYEHENFRIPYRKVVLSLLKSSRGSFYLYLGHWLEHSLFDKYMQRFARLPGERERSSTQNNQQCY